MHPSVIDKVRVCAEPLPAIGALIRFLSSMHPLMIDEVRAGTETSPTLATLKRFLSRVRSLVDKQFGSADEAFPAVSAFVGLFPHLRFLPRVQPLMLPKVRTGNKALSTFGAFIRFLAGMSSPVYNKVSFLIEAFTTL